MTQVLTTARLINGFVIALDQFGQQTIPITADQIKITKLWSILTPGQTENFDLVISAPQNGSGIYTGKVIIGCDPYADSISISAFVKAPGEEPSIVRKEPIGHVKSSAASNEAVEKVPPTKIGAT